MVFMPSCGHCIYCGEGRPALCEPGAAANGAGSLLNGDIRLSDNPGPIHPHLGCSAFATHAVVSERSLVRIDQDLPLDEAALFGCAVLTGVGAAVNTRRSGPANSVAVIGSAGSPCRADGRQGGRSACLVAVDLSPEKAGAGQELGATDCFDGRDTDALAAFAKTTGGLDVALRWRARSRRWSLLQPDRRGGTTVTAERAADRQPAAVGCPPGRRGTHVEGQLHRRLRAAARCPALHALYRAGRLPVDRLISGEPLRPDDSTRLRPPRAAPPCARSFVLGGHWPPVKTQVR